MPKMAEETKNLETEKRLSTPDSCQNSTNKNKMFLPELQTDMKLN